MGAWLKQNRFRSEYWGLSIISLLGSSRRYVANVAAFFESYDVLRNAGTGSAKPVRIGLYWGRAASKCGMHETRQISAKSCSALSVSWSVWLMAISPRDFTGYLNRAALT